MKVLNLAHVCSEACYLEWPFMTKQQWHGSWKIIYINDHFRKEVTAMGTHVSFMFWAYDPCIEGLKLTSFFMVLGSKDDSYLFNKPSHVLWYTWFFSSCNYVAKPTPGLTLIYPPKNQHDSGKSTIWRWLKMGIFQCHVSFQGCIFLWGLTTWLIRLGWKRRWIQWPKIPQLASAKCPIWLRHLETRHFLWTNNPGSNCSLLYYLQRLQTKRADREVMVHHHSKVSGWNWWDWRNVSIENCPLVLAKNKVGNKKTLLKKTGEVITSTLWKHKEKMHQQQKPQRFQA